MTKCLALWKKKKKKKRLQKKNLTGAGGVDLATYSQNHIDVAVRNGPGSLRPAPASTQ